MSRRAAKPASTSVSNQGARGRAAPDNTMKKILLILSLGAAMLGGCAVYVPDSGVVAAPQGGPATASARRARQRKAIAERGAQQKRPSYELHPKVGHLFNLWVQFTVTGLFSVAARLLQLARVLALHRLAVLMCAVRRAGAALVAIGGIGTIGIGQPRLLMRAAEPPPALPPLAWAAIETVHSRPTAQATIHRARTIFASSFWFWIPPIVGKCEQAYARQCNQS